MWVGGAFAVSVMISMLWTCPRCRQHRSVRKEDDDNLKTVGFDPVFGQGTGPSMWH